LKDNGVAGIEFNSEFEFVGFNNSDNAFDESVPNIDFKYLSSVPDDKDGVSNENEN
jgi:hypothetical protein